jgi:hypothetical protein
MKNAKFWFVQIAMVAIVGLIFGSPVLAGPPDHAKGAKGVEMKNAHGTAQDGNANPNAGFVADTGTGTSTGTGTGTDEEECQNWGTQYDADFNEIQVCLD